MSGFFGADTEQLRDHAQLLKQRAQKIVELRETLEPMVMNEGAWTGPDADAFRQQWSGQTARLFDLRHDDLTEHGSDLDRHAEQQDTTSGEGGAGGGAGDDFDPLAFLGGLGSDLQSLYGKLKDFKNWAGLLPGASGRYAELLERGLDGLWKQGFIDEVFNSGKGWQAMAESITSKLGIPNAIGNFEPMQMLNKLDNVAPWLKTAGSALGKAVPFLDVGTGIHQIATADNWYDRTSGILSTAGGALMIAAPFTGPAAPIVGAIGAGLGVVSAGMDLGKLVHENWGDITSTVGDIGSAIGEGVSNVGSAIGDGIGNAGEAIGDAGEAIGEGISDAGSAISDGIGNAGEAIGDAFGF